MQKCVNFQAKNHDKEKHHNKKILRGQTIKHIDGNTLNDKIDNLLLITTSGNPVVVLRCKNRKCNKEFTKKRGAKKYCSLKCYLEDVTVKSIICLNINCGKDFIPRLNSQRYCSHECYMSTRKNIYGKTKIVFVNIKGEEQPQRFTLSKNN